MPLFSKNHNKGIDFKKRLEHKLYLARENPDPVFDVSDCNLKAVPTGIYSLCKVFRKESLLLQTNQLTSLSGGGAFEDLYLLQVLDIRSNKLTSLPDDIQYLTSLKELYIDSNLLKTLPNSISELKCLRVLSCPYNKLRKLPQSIGNLKTLERLYLQGNPALCELPDELCLSSGLVDLVLDVGRYTHPPDGVVVEGTYSVMSYLAKHMGVEYNGPQVVIPECSNSENFNYEKELQALRRRDQEIQDRVRRFEDKKEEKIQERLSIEREINAQKDKEFQIQTDNRIEKDRLLEDLRLQENRLSEEVQKFQNQKDIDRCQLIEQLQLVELCADQFIDQMLSANKVLKDPAKVMEQDQRDRDCLDRLFNTQAQDLRKKEVLTAMESLLNEERMQKEKLKEYELAKAEIVRNSLSKELEWSEEVEALLRCRSSDQKALVENLASDEKDQVIAVATLLERNDLESLRLKAQLHLVEKQLAALTSLELQKKSLNLSQLQCDLSEKRVALSDLLVDILNQQQERKKLLLQTLIRMEHNRWEETELNDDYWLKQYQKLIDTMPSGFSCQGFDTRLVHQLVVYGVIHCLPFLAGLDIDTVSDDLLLEAGVIKSEDRASILKALTAYVEECYKETLLETPLPSAPCGDDVGEPSAPPVSSVTPNAECVVCFNFDCDTVFVPCGHLCCCLRCADQLSDCPLCRTNIDRKIRVISV